MKALSVSPRAHIDHYVSQIKRYPVLTREQEIDLAWHYRVTGDAAAARRLVACNLRFVVRLAHEYRGYGLDLLDLIQEGNTGLVIAVAKFDPQKGNRLISYATWWIRAYINAFVLRSHSIVKLGTTQAQRRLFFKLRSEGSRAEQEAGPGAVSTPADLAARLRVSETEVVRMQMRFAARDISLDTAMLEGISDATVLPDAEPVDPESLCERREKWHRVRLEVNKAVGHLNEREWFVVRNRLLRDDRMTLREIGNALEISRERVRQIEANAKRKLRARLTESGQRTGHAQMTH